MSKRIWFPLYASDLLTDSKIAQLSDAQFRMLIKVWCRLCIDRRLPSEPTGFSKVMGVSPKVASWALNWLDSWLSKDPVLENQLYSIRLEKELTKYDVIVERNRANGQKGGRPKKPSGFDSGNPEKSQSQSQKDIIPPQAEGKKKRKPREEKVEKPRKLKNILEWNDMDYEEVFWKVLEPFPNEKKTWPQTIATVFMDAVRSGTEPEAIYNAALSLSKSTNPQYMPNAAKWLKEEGWLAYANR